jgi:hypothetical protein
MASVRINALVYSLARDYFERRAEQVTALDEQLRAETDRFAVLAGTPDPGHTDGLREQMPVQAGQLMLEEWQDFTSGKIPVDEALAGARQLTADLAPPAIRDDLQAALDRILAGEAELRTPAARIFAGESAPGPGGLTGAAGAHLYAAVVAAMIDRLHPMVHNHARVLLEERIRAWRVVGKGMPAAEAVASISNEEADRVLAEVIPWIAEMTAPHHGPTKLDLRALVKLYLLDHPSVGLTEREELNQLIGRRLDEAATALGTPDTGKPVRTPPAPLTPEQIAARQRAERERRRDKRNRRR